MRCNNKYYKNKSPKELPQIAIYKQIGKFRRVNF